MREEDVQRYLDDIETVAQRDDIHGYTSLISEVANNPEQLSDTANEANRAVYYANQGQEVTIEPGSDDNIDLKTVDPKTGNTEYIELKQVRGKFDERKPVDLLFSARNSAQSKFDGTDTDVSDGDTVLEIRIQNPQNNIRMEKIDEGSTTKDATAAVREAIRLRKLNGKPIATDKVRVFLGNDDQPTETIDVEEIEI